MDYNLKSDFLLLIYLNFLITNQHFSLLNKQKDTSPLNFNDNQNAHYHRNFINCYSFYFKEETVNLSFDDQLMTALVKFIIERYSICLRLLSNNNCL